jgi:hypothetical protein
MDPQHLPLGRVTSRANPLDTSNFCGGFRPCDRPVAYGGQATYEGEVLVMSLDAKMVAGILPPGLSLARQKDPAVTTHPVIVMVGVQGAPRLVMHGQPVDVGYTAYDELMLMIPFTVKSDGGTQWHNYSARMYLDNMEAIILGDLIYAYAKEYAFFVRMLTKTCVMLVGRFFECDVRPTAPAVNLAGDLELPPGFAQIKKVFSMPIVGHFDTHYWMSERLESFPFSCSYFEWDFTHGHVTPANGQLRFIRQFRPGMQGWVDLGTIRNGLHGAFKLRGLRWRLEGEWPPYRQDGPPACNFY